MEIDIFDDHSVELEVIVSWINSAVGQQTKEQNPMGYLNVRAHAMQHQQAIQMAQQQAERKQLIMAAAMSQAEAAGKIEVEKEKPKPKAAAKGK